MIKPTNRRLTVVFTSVIIIFSITILYISYLFLHESIIRGVKRHMSEDIRGEFLDQFRRSGLDPFKNMWDEHRFQILNRQGGVVVSTRNSVDFYPETNQELLAKAFAGTQVFENSMVGNEPYLISYFPIDGKYVGRAAASVRGEIDYERSFVRLILFTFPAMLLLSYLVSRYLVNHAMKPISDVFTFQETFSSNVTHELRSPLASLKGNFEVALRKERTAEEYREILDAGLKDVDRIIDLLNNLYLLASSKFKPLDLFRGKTDINLIIKTVADAYAPSISEKRLRLTVSDLPGLTCLCDEGLIRRTIENLFDNALKYTPEGGQITVTVSSREGSIILAVSNTCATMTQAEKERLFEPFYRGMRSVSINSEGKGLGLYIARYIIRSHGGEIAVKKTDDNLFSLTVTLPMK
ncbi:MAG: GHKL domain-containing protein [Nitrospirae bacterium]|nr:GHKL domain-containing protein [Nitrospirota bacterium]